MAQGTLLPTPVFVAFNANGTISDNAIATFYLAGTTTLTPIYADVNLTTQLANPITADGSGRFAQIFLVPGQSYKMKLTDKNLVALDGYPADNILAVPVSADTLDVTGTAGEALSPDNVVYLSDGSGSKTAGLWYKADSANTYSSTLPQTGLVPNAIAIGNSGAIRREGSFETVTSLTVGATYYVGTAGAITTTAPSHPRIVGQAQTTNLLVLGDPPPVLLSNNAICQGRLTLTTLVPLPPADVTAATAVKFTPYAGNQIALYDGTSWTVVAFSELSVNVPATTASVYDVFAYLSSGAAAIELSTAWTSDVAIFASGTYAATRPLQDGVKVKSTNGTTIDNTRRYLGSFRTTAVSGQTEDSVTKRYLFNESNRGFRALQRFESTASWTYQTATVRQANGAAANQVEVLIGSPDVLMDLGLTFNVSSSGNVAVSAGIGEDSTTTYTVAAGVFAFNNSGVAPGNNASARLTKYPALGKHTYSWNEWSTASGTTTWYGNVSSIGSTITFGLSGSIQG